MLVFAYDGSLNGDWIAHYAVRFALATPARHLQLLHVHAGAAMPELEGRIARIAEECRALGVTLDTRVRASAHQPVADSVLASVGDEHDSILITGTRARPRDMSYLADTVALQLLLRATCTVLALHVMHPAMLGQPGRVLLPFMMSPPAPRAALPLLHLLAPDLRQLHVLVVHELSRLRFRLLGSRGARQLIEAARARATCIEAQLREALANCDSRLDSSAVVSDDAATETLALAGRLRSRLIALEVSSLLARPAYGHPLEQLLRDSASDVVLYRAAR